MKKILMASAATMALTGAAQAEDVTLGVILGFTGPIESITPGHGRWRRTGDGRGQ
jgi:branched-chain amino acid transport system substrate-binding protein